MSFPVTLKRDPGEDVVYELEVPSHNAFSRVLIMAPDSALVRTDMDYRSG